MGNPVSFFFFTTLFSFINTDNFLQSCADIGACSTAFALTEFWQQFGGCFLKLISEKEVGLREKFTDSFKVLLSFFC